jgi:acyl dehydratase
LDAAFAARTRFGEPIAHGLLGLAVAGGFLSNAGVVDGTAVALLEVGWRFVGPVKFGDTINAEIRVAETRETANPEHGTVRFEFEVVNRRNETFSAARRLLW